ncbi:hypothetical protein GN278_11090 [Rhodobacteraceae bacterium Araon29]
MKKMLNRYLQEYDKKPLVASLLGLLISISLGLIATWVLAAFANFLGSYMVIAIFLIAPFLLLILGLWIVVGLLLAEQMWVFFGIYKILGITNKPIRKSFNKWTGRNLQKSQIEIKSGNANKATEFAGG